MQKKVVSVRALVGRLNRTLKEEGVTLKKNRPNSVQPELGDWYTVNEHGVLDVDLNLEKVARGYGCLKTFEELEKE